MSTYKVKSRGSKGGSRKIVIGTSGLPTVPKDQGNRGVIVPLLGRTPGLGVCSYTTITGGSSTVSTDGFGKLQKIYELCKNNKDFVVKDKLYRLLYDKELYYAAYPKFNSNPDNMTNYRRRLACVGNLGCFAIPGIIPPSSEKVIVDIIDSLKNGTFQFQPMARLRQRKAKKGQRPLTIAPIRDKLVQECIRMILEAIYEPTFYESSHGFRPNRSCHSALKEVRQKFAKAK